MKSVSLIGALALGATADSSASACAQASSSELRGCDPFCGYEAIKAGDDHLCLRSNPKVADFPLAMDTEDQEEYCALVAANYGCNNMCGYKWNSAAGECTPAGSQQEQQQQEEVSDAPIIGGYGKFRYQYMPDLMQPPAGASLVNCHGLVTDKDANIFLTYQNDGKDLNCLIKWKPDGTGAEFMSGGNSTLCSGTPHGLKITTEGDTQYLYHANNNQKLTKTTMDGTILWQVNGLFGQDTKVYRPTWFATPPNTKYIYLCDGYGSNQVYAFDRTNGKFLNRTWGGKSSGKGPDEAHGTFSTNHGCTYDSRLENTIVVSDRANSRLEFFNYDPLTPDVFNYTHTVNMQPGLGNGTLPCNLRMYPDQEGRGIIPDLSGPVAVLDNTNTVISVVQVSVLLASLEHKHPHDAIFLPNGDMVVATWAPGRISYWKLLPA